MDTELSFEDYLKSKKIDQKAFESAEPERFQEWKELFTQVHPDSFTLQKKFLLNPIRRKYQLQEN